MCNNLANATGQVRYTFLNDYMFKKILQDNTDILKSLLQSLLRLESDDIKSIEVRNPIKPGTSIISKEFILDLLIEIYDLGVINLEMQVINYRDWPERSLQYLCRTFDRLQKGKDYSGSKPAIQISFLNFNLFEDHKEFYATYMLRNTKDSHIYTDKFILKYISMPNIALATKEDIDYDLVRWVRIFKAKTWEELKMLAEENEFMTKAVNTLYAANGDLAETLEAQAREDYILHEQKQKAYIKKIETEMASMQAAITGKDAEIARLKQLLADSNL